MKRLGIVVMMLSCVAPSAWAQAGKNPDVDKVRMAYQKAAVAGDVPALVALYTNDAVVMPPDMPMVKGKANVEAFHKKMQAMAKLSDVQITPTDTQIIGDTAIDAGTYRQTVTPTGGKPMADVGKYIVILKKQADGWKLAYEIYNADQPAPPMPSTMKK